MYEAEAMQAKDLLQVVGNKIIFYYQDFLILSILENKLTTQRIRDEWKLVGIFQYCHKVGMV